MSIETSEWKTVSVFISSTFSDMHAERDLLVKRVYPELRKWCEERRLRLVILDLRWGVTEHDATQNRDALRICLRGIDEARPLFVCFIGQRRGWVPAPEDVSTETLETYPEARAWIGRASITEMEILHALAAGDQAGVLNGLKNDADVLQKSALFYLRDNSYLDSLLKDAPRLGPLYTNSAIELEELRTIADNELSDWRERRIPQLGAPAHRYRARWDPESRTPELCLPLVSSSSQGAAAWRKSWRQSGLELDDRETSIPAELLGRATQINDELSKGRLSGFQCIRIDSESGTPTETHRPLADQVLIDLKTAISAQYPDRGQATGDPTLREQAQHETFARRLADVYVEQLGDFDQLDAYLDDPDDRRVLFLSGKAGTGKSTRLARWMERLAQRQPANGCRHVMRFIGAGDWSTSVNSLWRSIFAELQIPPPDEAATATIIDHLNSQASQAPFLLILDGLDQLDDGLVNLNWLTRFLSTPLPSQIKIVASFRSDAAGASLLTSQIVESSHGALIEIQGLQRKEYRRRLVEERLARRLKRLDESDIELVINYPGSSNPLFLSVLLDELWIYGSFAGLHQQVQASYGETPQDAFLGVLKRMESDPAYTAVAPRTSIPVVTAILAAARHGLPEDDLARLLADALPQSDIESPKTHLLRDAQDAVSLLIHQLSPYLATRSGRIDLLYSAFRDAVVQRYFNNSEIPGSRSVTDWHQLLAAHFTVEWPIGNTVALRELPYHLAASGQAGKFTETLTDPLYLDSRCRNGDVLDLISDFNFLEQSTDSRLTQQFLRSHSQSLLRHSEGLPGLIVREGPQVVRTRLLASLDSGNWPQPLIFSKPLWQPPRNTTAPTRPMFDALTPVSFDRRVQDACLAMAVRRIFILASTGDVQQIELDSGRVDHPRFKLAEGFIQTICCDTDGGTLGLMLEDGRAIVRTWRLDDSGRPLDSQILGTTQYRRPAVERPFGMIASACFWYQGVDGHLESWQLDSARIKRWQLPETAATGELRWLSCDPDGQLWVVISTREALLIVNTGQGASEQTEVPKADLLSACQVEPGVIAIATTDYQVRFFSRRPTTRKVGQTTTEYAVNALCAAEGCLWGIAEHGVIYQLRYQCTFELESAIEFGCSQRFPEALALAASPGGQFIAVTKTGATRLQRRERAESRELPIQAAYSAGDGMGGYYALRGTHDLHGKSTDTLEFVDSVSGVVREVVSNSGHPFVFAANEHQQILACRTAGKGFVLDLNYHGMHQIDDLMDGVVSACSGPGHLFYLTDRMGQILCFDANAGTTHRLGSAPLVNLKSPKLSRVGNEIVLIGQCESDTGGLVDFIAILEGQSLARRRIQIATMRRFRVADGLMKATAVDGAGQKLCSLWSEGDGYRSAIRVGSLEQFLSQRETVHVVNDLTGLTAVEFSSDGSLLFVIHGGGALSAVDVSSGIRRGVLTGSLPFTDLVPTSDEPQSVLVVEDRRQILQCRLWQPKGPISCFPG